MNMIEKVARAAYDNYFDGQIGCTEPSWNELPPDYKDRLFNSMKAAIEAMREPTNDMANEYYKLRKEVGDIDITACFNVSIWETMIDAALKE